MPRYVNGWRVRSYRPQWYINYLLNFHGSLHTINRELRLIRVMTPYDTVLAVVYSTRKHRKLYPVSTYYDKYATELYCILICEIPIFLSTIRLIYWRGVWYSATLNYITEYDSQFTVVDCHYYNVQQSKKYSNLIVKKTIHKLWMNKHLNTGDNFTMIF
jgi:hypothetical protein